MPLPGETTIREDIDGKSILLVDDVFHTGRTARAALCALMEHGRPEKVTFAVLIKRKRGKELPIEPDFYAAEWDIPEGYEVKIDFQRKVALIQRANKK